MTVSSLDSGVPAVAEVVSPASQTSPANKTTPPKESILDLAFCMAELSGARGQKQAGSRSRCD
jgi:hypothetical protein